MSKSGVGGSLQFLKSKIRKENKVHPKAGRRRGEKEGQLEVKLNAKLSH